MTCFGIDVSKWQTSLPDLSTVDFLFARASIGTLPDERYEDHIREAKAAGIITGAYHFNWDSISIAAQVSTFIAAAGDVDLFAIDVEGLNAFDQSQTREFIRLMHEAGLECGLYHSASGFFDAGQDWDWVAKWSPTPPAVYDFWQFTSSGTLPGYSGRLDFDLFKGTLAELYALAGRETHKMDDYRAVGEDWTTDKAPVRMVPDRDAPAEVTFPQGSTIRTVAEFKQDGQDWRVTRLADGRTGFLIRGDLTPLKPGGDPAVDAPFVAYTQRQSVPPDAISCKPYVDADRKKAYVAWRP